MPLNSWSCRAMLGTLSAVAGLALASCATMPAAADGPSARTVAIATADGTASARLFTPAGAGPWRGVLVWPDLAGLRPAYDAIGRDLSAAGYVVLIPNNFYRSAALDGSQGSGALDQDEMRARLADWRAAADDDAIDRDAGAYVAFLDAQDAVDTGRKIGTVGYNVGAAHAFRAAAAMLDRIGAVAVAHPLGVATARPNSPHLLIGKTKASYLVVMAKPDDDREPDDKDDLRRAFANAGLSGQVDVVDAGHGFALSDNPAYDPAAAKDFHDRLLALFDRALR